MAAAPTTIVIDPEIANLCRSLTAEEKAQLEQNLRDEGCRDPLVVWHGTLLDGHNRHEICKRLGLEFQVVAATHISDRQSAINWVIANQLGRRNLNPEEQSYLRGKRYEVEKPTPEERLRRFAAASERATKAALVARGLRVPDRSGKNYHPGQRTAEKLGREFGIGEKAIRDDAAFATAVDKIGEALGKETAHLIRSGKSDLTKKAVVAFSKEPDMTLQKFNNLRFEEQRRREKQRKERKKSAPKAPPLSTLKRPDSEVHDTVRSIERMRPFMNALIQIATMPVTALTLANDPWPKGWRQQVTESLPLAQSYLADLARVFIGNGTETIHGDQQNEAEQDADRA